LRLSSDEPCSSARARRDARSIAGRPEAWLPKSKAQAWLAHSKAFGSPAEILQA